MARRNIHGLRTIVTGASSGIGRALVIELVSRGARVVALARRADRLRELEEKLAAPDRFAWLAGDVTRREDRTAAMDLCCTRFGGLDALVNNAGFGKTGPFAQADEARLRAIFEVNFFAAAEFMREALPQLRLGEHPIIVNISSVLGHTAVPGKSEYCASKFALHGLSDALRLELSREGIDLLLVSPSTTATEFFDIAGRSRPPGGTHDGEGREGEAPAEPRASPSSTSRFGAMSADSVARRIVTAMRTGRREIILSASGKFLVWLDRLCPPLAQWFISRWL